MSDLYNMLIDELEKNDIFVHYSTIEPKIILDLSGHDKPFKVKIRELEESYQKNAREIHTLEKDNLFFKQRITEIENKRNRMYEISKIFRKNCNNFYKENKELKQHIAELERENEKLFDYLNGTTGNTKEEMDITLNTLDLELQNNKISVLKENEKVVGLDFSEHDKVFEDTIAELEQRIRELIKEKDEYKRKCNDFGFENQDLKKITKSYENKIAELEKEVINYKQAFKDKCKDYDFTSELLNKYVAENESLERRIQELDTIDTIRIDENRELKQRIAELDSMKMENFSEIDTSNPLACAESLIEHMTHCEKFMIMPERDVQTFSVEELKEIADYLMVYYKHHKYRDEEDTISF